MADLLKPLVVHRGGERAPSAPPRAGPGARERALRLPAEGGTTWRGLFAAVAAAALKQRCVVCRRSVQPEERHRALHAPLCGGEPSCRAAYPTVPLERAAAALGAIPRREREPGAARAAAEAAHAGPFGQLRGVERSGIAFEPNRMRSTHHEIAIGATINCKMIVIYTMQVVNRTVHTTV
jgi:predicted RNA-binding Zn-ribbon protein involved in translation (DUF1610 family)